MSSRKSYSLNWILNKRAAKQHGLLEFDWNSLPIEREKYLLKEGPEGDILYLPPEGERSGIIVKIFLNTSLKDRLLDFVRPSKASREFYFAKLLPRRGVPSAVPLGYSLLRGGFLPKGSVFASVELPTRQTLRRFLDSAPSPQLRKSALQRYGSMLGKLNRVSLYIEDFQLDNVLVEAASGQDPVYWVIDHEASWPLLAWLKPFRLRNLCSALYADRELELSGDERKAILRSYLQQLHKRAPTAEEVNNLLRLVENYHGSNPLEQGGKQSEISYRGPEQYGPLRVFRHRLVDGAELAAAFENLRQGEPVQALRFKDKKVRVEPELLARGGLFGRLKELCGAGAGRKVLGRERAGRSSRQRMLVGYVERRPFGPAALFWIRTMTKSKKKPARRRMLADPARKKKQPPSERRDAQ